MDALARMQRGEPVDQGLVNLRPADAVGAHPDGGEDATRRLSSGLAAWDEGGAQHAGELFGSAAVDRVPRTQAFGEASHGARPHRRVRITRWLQYTVSVRGTHLEDRTRNRRRWRHGKRDGAVCRD